MGELQAVELLPLMLRLVELRGDRGRAAAAAGAGLVVVELPGLASSCRRRAAGHGHQVAELHAVELLARATRWASCRLSSCCRWCCAWSTVAASSCWPWSPGGRAAAPGRAAAAVVCLVVVVVVIELQAVELMPLVPRLVELPPVQDNAPAALSFRLIPGCMPGAPFWVGAALSFGGAAFARGGRMRDKHSRGSAGNAAGVPNGAISSTAPPGIKALASRLQHVPCESELMALPALGDAYRLLYEQTAGKQNCAPAQAGKIVVDALLGDVPEIEACPLTVYRLYSSGPVALSAADVQLDGSVFPSERKLALQALRMPLIYGDSLSRIAEARVLAVLRDEAAKVFGLHSLAAVMVRPVGAVQPGRGWPVHDWRRWGTAATADGLTLRRVADVVALRCDERTSIERAVRSVLTELHQALPQCADWYMLSPGLDPEPLDESDVWEAWPPDNFGGPPRSYPEWKRHSKATAGPWHFFVGENSLNGGRGLVECLQSTMSHARSIAELDAGLAGCVAVPESVACAVAGVAQIEPLSVPAVVDMPAAVVEPQPTGLREVKLANAWRTAKSRAAGAGWQQCHIDAVNELRALDVSDVKIANGLGIARKAVQLKCGTRREFDAARSHAGAMSGIVRTLAGGSA
ncbi:MAG: hypothetical protein V4795_00480 [Pseudomonadota bacterium]